MHGFSNKVNDYDEFINKKFHDSLFLLVLKYRGTHDAQAYIHQVIRTYPKFTPLLYSRIPEYLIPVIWNDPVMQQLATIIGNKQVIDLFSFFSLKNKNDSFGLG